MRRAVWRASPDDPSGGLRLFARWIREVARGADLHGAVRMVHSLAFVAALCTLPFVAGFVVLVLFDGWTLVGWGGWIAGVAAFVVAVRWVGLSHRLLWQRPLGGFDRILPLPLPEGTFPVYIAVRFLGWLTGMDEAAASFVEGWLHVEGSRTSFSLRYGDVRSEWGKERLKVAFSDGTSVVLWAAGDRDLPFDPRDFEESARRWVAHGHRPSGESILPPLEVHPLMRKGWVLATLASGLLAIASAAFLERVRFDPWGIVLALAAALFAVRGAVVVSEHAAAEVQANALEGDRSAPLSL